MPSFLSFASCMMGHGCPKEVRHIEAHAEYKKYAQQQFMLLLETYEEERRGEKAFVNDNTTQRIITHQIIGSKMKQTLHQNTEYA